MSTRVSFCITFFLLSVLAYSQNSEIKELNALIVNDEIEKSGIVVINKSSGGTTITDKDGFFSIGVSLKDSLFIRSIQIKDYYLYINEEIFKSNPTKRNLFGKFNKN